MKKTLLFLIILLTIIISPKVNAEMIRIYDDEITSITENLEGKIYKLGTPIKINDYPYIINYKAISLITSYTHTTTSDTYIGYNTENVDLSEYSDYWEIDSTHRNASYYEINLIPAVTNYNMCNIDELNIGDTCNYKSIAISTFWAGLKYNDKNGNLIGENYVEMFENRFPYVGITGNDESLEETSKVWRIADIQGGGSFIYITFEPTEEEPNYKVDFTLTCDKETINYKDKTTCHFNAKNYMITGDEIIITLEEKDDLELVKLIPSNYFSVENNNNTIKVTPKYISTTRENVELFSFEVKANKEKNEIDNITISDISYYNGETYTNLKTTINIENRNYLTSNPLTANPTLFKIILVSAFLISCTTLLIKRESV